MQECHKVVKNRRVTKNHEKFKFVIIVYEETYLRSECSLNYLFIRNKSLKAKVKYNTIKIWPQLKITCNYEFEDFGYSFHGTVICEFPTFP